LDITGLVVGKYKILYFPLSNPALAGIPLESGVCLTPDGIPLGLSLLGALSYLDGVPLGSSPHYLFLVTPALLTEAA